MADYNEDREVLKAMFDKDNIDIPEELLPENIIKSLPEQKSPKKRLYKYLAVAAAVLICSVSALVYSIGNFTNVSGPKGTNVNLNLPKTNVSSNLNNKNKENGEYHELYKALQTEYENNKKFEMDRNYNGDTINYAYETIATQKSPLGGSTANSEKIISETNTQVNGVDEADIIKTDGEYLYYVTESENPIVQICKTSNGKLTSESKIELTSESKIKFNIMHELYLYKNMLVLITVNIDIDFKTTVLIYDITDKQNPKQINKFIQDGVYTTSRLINGQLYTVTNVYSNLSKFKEDEISKYVPGVKIGNNEKSYVSGSNICIVKNCDPNIFCMISNINIEKNDKPIELLASLSSDPEVYANTQNIYLFSSGDNNSTNIYRYEIKNGGLLKAGDTQVKGHLLNQFSADERNGFLRVVTTYSDKKNRNVNLLTVFNNSLSKVSEIDNIAKNERVYSARFIGEMAYVVTYRETDPLFSISLKDPYNPKIIGELKIPGFSEYLHPYGDNMLIGVGDDGEGFIKVSLFDISDDKNPKQLDSYTLKKPNWEDSHTQVSETHKAFTYLEDKDLIIIPYVAYVYTSSYNSSESGSLCFKIVNNKIVIDKILITDEDCDVYRSVRINNVLYVMDSNGLTSYNLDDYSKIDRCKV